MSQSLSSTSSKVRSGMDLATRSIDLLSTLIQASENRSHSAVGLMIEIAKWLGREKLNESELEDCFRRGRDIFTPNEDTAAFFDDVLKDSSNRTFLTLHTRTTGSLGHLIARDPQLSWMVSTVACLFQYVGEYDVNHAIRALLRHGGVEPSDQKTGKPSHDNFKSETPSSAHMGRVVRAIVSSIWFNVVNAGHATMKLPDELIAVCNHGHVLQSSYLAFLITVLKKPRQRVILKSQRLYRNITHWVLLHFEGRVQVTVSGKIVYNQTLGNSNRDIEFRVESFCNDSGDCQENHGDFQLIEEIAGTFEQLFKRDALPASASSFKAVPTIRRPLYELPRRYNEKHKSTLPSIQLQVRHTAQKIAAWLLDLPICSPNDFTHFGFSIPTFEDAAVRPIGTLASVLARTPQILNMNWGNIKSTKLVFVEIEQINDIPSDRTPPDPILAPDRRFEEILPSFPILGDLMSEVAQHCSCQRCNQDNEILPGCLKHAAMADCLYLLAHAVADSFGAEDVSGATDITPITEGMLQILLDIIEEKGVIWNVWFSVASCVLLGCPNSTVPTRTDPMLAGATQTTTTIAAVQYGNLVTMAPWLDLNREIQIPGSFRLLTRRGRLGVERGHHTSYTTFSSISDEFAVIGTEMTDSTATYVAMFKQEPEHPPTSPSSHLDPDTVECATDCMLVRIDEYYFSLMTRVVTADHSRVVDPSDVLTRIARGIVSILCAPDCEKTRPPQGTYTHHNFSDVLGRWEKWHHMHRFMRPESPTPPEDRSIEDGEDEPMRYKQRFIQTSTLDTHLKKNVALALSLNGLAIVNNGSACLACLDRETDDDPLRKTYVINTQKTLSHLQLDTKRMKHLLLEHERENH
jgi:hypothetical protein